jgi:hypothetical protein
VDLAVNTITFFFGFLFLLFSLDAVLEIFFVDCRWVGLPVY